MRFNFEGLLDLSAGTLGKYERTFKKVCSYPFLSISSTYAGLLGFLGVLLSIYDILRIIKNGPVLPSELWRSRIKTGRLVSPECERDLKLISLVLSLEYYFLLICGSAVGFPVLMVPWLSLYALIIAMEFIIFCLTIFTEGVSFHKHSLMMSMFVIYNWLSIFCAFCRLTNNRCR